MNVVAWQSESPAQTLKFGRVLGRLVRPGELLALCGPLGSGKTQFVKGLAAGLGVPADERIISPTFVLVREYVGRLRLYHVDAYRLASGGELLDLGLEEMLEDPQGVVAIEWADRAAEVLPAGGWWLELAHSGPRKRGLTLRAPDARRAAAVARRVRRQGAKLRICG